MRIGYGAPPSRSSTSRISGIGATSPAPPSTRSTAFALCGRNGASSTLQSATACVVTCRIVPSRSRSSSPLSFHGALSETYLLTSATVRIASASAAFWRCRPISPPTVPKAASHGVEQRLVGRLERAGGRDLPEALGDHVRGAVDQVAPAGDELVVGAADELRPGEVAVLVLRAGRGDEVAQRVGLVALEHVADVDHHAPRGRELLALHREELAGDHLGRQVQRAVLPRLAAAVAPAVVREELGGPDLGVEGDVVLAHEVVGQRLGVVPPLAPAVGLAERGGPTPRTPRGSR